jgi:hypothetical protein
MPRPPYDDRVREQREKDRPSRPVEDEPDYGGEVEDDEPPRGLCADMYGATIDTCGKCELEATCGASWCSGGGLE